MVLVIELSEGYISRGWSRLAACDTGSALLDEEAGLDTASTFSVGLTQRHLSSSALHGVPFSFGLTRRDLPPFSSTRAYISS